MFTSRLKDAAAVLALLFAMTLATMWALGRTRGRVETNAFPLWRSSAASIDILIRGDSIGISRRVPFAPGELTAEWLDRMEMAMMRIRPPDPRRFGFVWIDEEANDIPPEGTGVIFLNHIHAWHVRYVAMPVGLAISLLLFLPAFRLRQHLLRRRDRKWQRLGRCPACGYDLRASPSQCPECGINTSDV